MVLQENVIALYNGEKYVLGEYSSKEKAYKAMEMLREAYVGMPIVMQNVDISEDVAKEFERLKKCGVMVQIENQPSKVDFISNAVFQFPQDDEIEV
jgi:chromosome condensin MukBEF MukE localization factor